MVVAGSTRGQGEGYGNAEGNDEDGFITILNTDTGELSDMADLDRSNKRIGTAEDDIIAGICDDPMDVNSFYIVGATKGDMGQPSQDASPPQGSLKAYAQKMDIRTLEPPLRSTMAPISANDKPSK